MSADINISNYEDYLYSYVDGELNADEQAALERFLAANPSLQAELDLLMSTRLQPEPLVFENKALLYRGNEINLQNYETYLLSYIDNELNAEEARALELFMAQHTKVREELVMWQGTRLHADPAIRFENKQSLYRHTNVRKMRPAYWWAASAAAVVTGAMVFFLMNRPDAPDGQLAGNAPQTQVNTTPDAAGTAQQATDIADQQGASTVDQQTADVAVTDQQTETTTGQQVNSQPPASQQPAQVNTSAQTSRTSGQQTLIAQQHSSEIKETAEANTQGAPDLASVQTQTSKAIDRQQLETTLKTPEKVIIASQQEVAAASKPSLDPQSPPSALATQAPAAEPGELIMSVTSNGLESKVLDKVTNVARFFAKKKKNN